MTRLFVLICSLVTLAAAAFSAWTFVHNPMDEHASALDAELAAIQPAPAEYSTDSGLNFERIYADVEGKSGLWNELVAPLPKPKPKPKPAAAPDLAKLLKGVSPGRNQVGSRVQIKTPTDRKGSYLGVGDQVNGVVILEIKRTEILFGITKNGKDYTHTLPRQ